VNSTRLSLEAIVVELTQAVAVNSTTMSDRAIVVELDPRRQVLESRPTDR
jgi:hypothetical protein